MLFDMLLATSFTEGSKFGLLSRTLIGGRLCPEAFPSCLFEEPRASSQRRIGTFIRSGNALTADFQTARRTRSLSLSSLAFPSKAIRAAKIGIA